VWWWAWELRSTRRVGVTRLSRHLQDVRHGDADY
jgi:hypothetical protein